MNGSMSPAPGVRVGTAGWSYPDWEGTVYPSGSRGPAPLRAIAALFDCVEVNRTFYGGLASSDAERWTEAVADHPGFTFTLKAPRSLTHTRESVAAEIVAECARFRDGLEPISRASRLGGILVQFPWYFEDSSANRERIRAIASELAPLPVFVEVRHTSFVSTSRGGALPFFEDIGVGFVNIDLPRARTAPSLSSVNTSSVGYFRLHGRNHRAWFSRESSRDEKYDYLYSVSELGTIARAVERVAARALSTYVIANNHFRGQAVANALQLVRMLGGTPPPAPRSLVDVYPSLAGPRAPERVEESPS